jgi:osmoprotectant transport system ATP-binding protein
MQESSVVSRQSSIVNTMIQFEGVTKCYPGAAAPAVDDCSFTVEDGTLAVILGPSGCGKTTLLKMVNRLYEPTSGRILLDGCDVRAFDVNALRRQIGYQIQQVGLFPHMTVAQNVAVVPRLLGWPAAKITARVDELLGMVDLPPAQYRTRFPAQLSGGQQQRVGLARALAGDPQVLLMDEPFGAIDAITRATLQSEILRLQARLKKTILFVTHDVDEALRLADVIAILRDGRLAQYGTPLDVLTNPAGEFVRSLMGADDLLRQLGLLRVETAMSPVPPAYRRDEQPCMRAGDDLRHALSLLLCTGAPSITVLDHLAESHVIGTLTLDQIRDVATGRRCA